MRLPAIAALLALVACSDADARQPGAAAPAAPAPGGELLVMNDGMKPVTGVRLRRAAQEGAWSAELLGGEPIAVMEGRRFDLAGLDVDCNVEVELTITGQPSPVLGEQDVCSGDPRFWIAFALGLDEPGMGRPGAYAVIVGEETAPTRPRPARTGAVRGAPDLNRGLPVCPGDPRCRKKK